MQTRPFALCSLLLAASTARPAPAQTAAEEPRETPPAAPQTIFGEKDVPLGEEEAGGGVSVSIEPSYRLQFDTNVDNAGEFGVNRARLGLIFSGALTDTLRLSVDLSGEWSDYDFDGATDIVASGEPITDAYTYRVSPALFWAFKEDWGLLVGGSIEASYEDGADFGDSIRYGGFGGVRYQWTEDFALTLGVNVATRLEDDALVIPLIGIDWQVSDAVTVRTEGPGAAAVLDMGDGFFFTLRGRWEPREYRLDDSGPIPDGVLRDEAILVGAEVAYQPSSAFLVAAEVGGVFNQSFETLNSNGNELTDVDADAALYIGFRATIRF